MPIARLVFAALDGLTLQQLLYDEPRRTEETISALRQMLALVAANSAGRRTDATTSPETLARPHSNV